MLADIKTRKRIIIIAIVIFLVVIIGLFIFIRNDNTKDIIQGQEVKSLSQEDENGFSSEAEKGKVIVIYQDEQGNSIAENDEIEGIIGNEYTTNRKVIPHYTTSGKEPLNKIGNYKKEDITVKYIYKKTSEFINVNQDENNVVTLQVENIKTDKDYKLLLTQKSTEGKNLTGGQFSVQNDSEQVDGITTNGLLTLGNINVCDEGTEDYKISENVAPLGYEKALKNGQYDLKMEKKYNDQTKQYEIIAMSDNQVYSLEQTSDDEIIVKVVNEKTKTYELAMKKFASYIDKTKTNREITARIDETGNIVYDQTTEDINVRDYEKITYTLRIFNEGNQDMEGKMVTDILPKGLKFVENSQTNNTYGWTKQGDNLTTNYLIGKTIEGFDIENNETPKFIDINLEVEVDEQSADLSSNNLTNIGKIEIDEREKNQNNNEDTDTVILAKMPQIYDLAIKKFASYIDGQPSKRDVTVKLNENNQIEYQENRPNITVKDNQQVIYTLRVFNEGNTTVQGKKITDKIPQGLEFKDNSTINTQYGWQKNGDSIETTYLENKTINGARTYRGEVPQYIDLQVEFTVIERNAANDNLILNTAKISKLENETDDIDNEDTDILELEAMKKTCNFAIKKFASSIDGQNTSRDVTVQLTQENKVKYVEKRPEITVKKGQKVIYTIRVFNEGNEDTTGEKVIDKIPEGLKYLPESEINKLYGWELKENNNIETNYLKNKTIQGSYITRGEIPQNIDIKLELEVTEDGIDKETVNTIVNKVNIEKKENETQINDNEDTDTLLLEKNEDTYDLVLKKFVNKIDNESIEKEITASVNESAQIVYANENTKTDVNKGQVVEFTIRIFNEGNQDMVCSKITDIIPQGLKYIENSQINKDFKWELNNNEISTNYLAGKTLKGFNEKDSKNLDYLDVQIELQVLEEDIKQNELITNIAKIEAGENETKLENNQDECTLKVVPEKQKIFDLSLQKYIYSVDGTKLENREIVAKNEDGKIQYVKNNEIYKVANGQKVVFTLRVFNEGDGQTTGRDLYEYIPKGLEYIEDSQINKENGWKMYKQDKSGNFIEVNSLKDVTVLKTEKLNNQTIPGCVISNNEVPRYRDIQVEFKVDESKVKYDDRVITNKAQIKENRLELNQKNDNAEEKLQVKKFDLELTKYIKEITIKDDTGEKTTKLGLNQKGKIFKKEINNKKLDKTQVYVTYGLKIKNIGDIEGYASQIYDYIPENFELISNNIWERNESIAKTNTLAKTIINPGESKTVEITFKWDLSKGNLGERNNKAIIEKYQNNYNAIDETQDNKNEEKFIISVKTGVYETSMIGILSILIISVIIIGIKIKKN